MDIDTARRRLTAVIAGVLLAAATNPVGGTERLRLRVTPSVSYAPAWVTVRVSIDPDRDNRSVQIIAESDNFFRASELPLDGDHAAQTNSVEYRGLPAGEYDIQAILIGSDGQARAKTSQEIMVAQ